MRKGRPRAAFFIARQNPGLCHPERSEGSGFCVSQQRPRFLGASLLGMTRTCNSYLVFSATDLACVNKYR